MESRTYECDQCEEVHEAEVMSSLPVRSLSESDVSALNSSEKFNAVIGFDYHECEMHPDNAVATEELMIERESEMLALRLIPEIGWAVDARQEILDGANRETAVQKTIEKIQQDAVSDGHNHPE